MTETDVTARLKKAFDSVPNAAGVNNHQGSKATENARIMGMVLPYLKDRKLFFLDSVTTNRSICAKICKDMGVRYAKRDIFLDLPERRLKGKNLKNYIHGQLDKLIELAVTRGCAIGIGHDRPTTLRIIREMIPELERIGIKIVRASELAHSSDRNR